MIYGMSHTDREHIDALLKDARERTTDLRANIRVVALLACDLVEALVYQLREIDQEARRWRQVERSRQRK